MAETTVQHLLPHHAELIAASGISREVGQARGYFSAIGVEELSALCFEEYQCCVPALAIPVWTVRGKIAFHQIRPDAPRVRGGKAVKYETPARVQLVIDVPPPIRHLLGDPKVPLFITEGVRKADAGVSKGLCCVDILGVWGWRGANAQGGKTALVDWEYIALKEREVYLAFDSDVTRKPEVAAALGRLKSFLEGRGARIRVIYLPDDGSKVGLDDFLVDHPVEELLKFASDSIVEVQAKAIAPQRSSWPELQPEALYGLAGDIVRAIGPYTEADPVATLSNLLVGIGNQVGRRPYATVQADEHPSRLFILQIGATSKGRKGMGWSPIKKILQSVDPEWKTASGLSSGEGVIYAIRDPRRERHPKKDRGCVVGYEEVEADPGVADKRLLVIEPEFATVLKMMERQGNSLSGILRQAWDGDDLSPLIKNNRDSATQPHISILGHITMEELTRYLVETEKCNGFANRFIFLLVRRSKELPNPQPLPDAVLNPLIAQLRSALEFAKGLFVIRRDPAAERDWERVYGALTAGKPGMTGAILNRAEAQVLRLSVGYALLDRSPEIRPPHQCAGLALWQYAEESVQIIFGDATGNPVADTIMRALRDIGQLDRTGISMLFGHHQPGNRIEAALGLLMKAGMAHPESIETGGRSKEVWRVGVAKKAK